MPTNPNGRVLYEGPSPIDGAPIVCIITGFTESSDNGKTGSMLQTWILRQDIAPNIGYRDGSNLSICGGCHHFTQKTCYVTWHQAPLSVWRCYKRGGYAHLTDYSVLDGFDLRIGSAGDPYCVPEPVWRACLAHTRHHTGYTAQWRRTDAQSLRDLLQASCHGFRDYLDATAHGWQPYLVTEPGQPAPAGLTLCPASAEAGHATTCSACHACDGSTGGYYIPAHGTRALAFSSRN
jgi:hypothetical protein